MQTTPYFDRFCILFLSFEWIIFGSMHFSFPAATEAQIPEFIPVGVRPMIAVITGMLEVTTGILMLVSSVRRWAALSSIILLVLFIPAVYHILASDSAIVGPPAWQVFFRLLLLPNNILLALCSIHLFQNPSTSNIAAAQIINDALSPRSSFSNEKATALVAFLLLASNCAGFLVILGSAAVQDRETAYLWAMMCIATGAFIGFLFGVPRVNPAAGENSDLRPNTNIETVSDWLTKILVGVGLINLKQIGDFLNSMSSELNGSLKAGESFALALIVYFFVVGLIQGYLLTRMFLARQFSAEPPR
jgi:uncharacterized membrane protein